MVACMMSCPKLVFLVALWLSISSIIVAETPNPLDDNIPSPVACFNCSLCEYPCDPSPPATPAFQPFAPPPPPPSSMPVPSNCPPSPPSQCCQVPPPGPPHAPNIPYYNYGTSPPLRFSNRPLGSLLDYSLFILFFGVIL